jgi:peptidoglycan/LPS O-acetylase OafA/YrhL
MNEKKIIPALTGIRAICVYFIFFKHLNCFSQESQPHLWLIVNQFYCFLNFFFVLSGFLIYYRYSDISSFNKTTLYNYFVNRMARVYPILIILISATFFIAYYHHYYSGIETFKLYLLNITLIKGFSSKYYLTGIGPSWSMSVEELFYLLSPLIFLFAKNIFSLFKIVLFFFGIGLLLTIIFHYFPFEGFFGDFLFTAYSTFFGRVFEFACGIFLGMLVKQNTPICHLQNLGKKTQFLSFAIIITSIALLYCTASINNLSHAIESWEGIAVNNILLPIGITILFYNLIYYESLLQKFLSSAIMVNLGSATYSFYLLHTTFVLSYINKYVSKNVFVIFILMVIISFIFYKLVEQPLAILVRKKLYKHSLQEVY